MARDEISPLPEVITFIKGPDYLNPSSFGDLLECPLMVVNGLQERDLLPPRPEAILGTLIHSVIHRLHRTSPELVDSVAEAMAIFEEVLKSAETNLEKDLATRPLVPLREAVGRSFWRDGLALLRKWASMLNVTIGGNEPTKTSSERKNINACSMMRQSSKIVFGLEKKMDVPELRLKGKPDLIERASDGTIHITDLKTGRILASNKVPKEKYALQLRLYALMVESLEPQARIKLWLKSDQLIEIEWDDSFRSSVVNQLQEMSDLLPPGALIPAESIARDGRHCWRCRARHRCPLYLRVAPIWWKRVSPSGPVAPFDTWGEIRDIKTKDGQVTEIEIEDAASRRVLIRGLYGRVSNSLELGDTVWFFDLEPTEVLPQHRAYIHPRNFHGNAPGPAWRDALRLRVYAAFTSRPESIP